MLLHPPTHAVAHLGRLGARRAGHGHHAGGPLRGARLAEPIHKCRLESRVRPERTGGEHLSGVTCDRLGHVDLGVEAERQQDGHHHHAVTRRDEAVHHDVELRLLHVHVGHLDGDVRQPLGCRARDGQHGGLAVRIVGAVSTDHERRSHALTSNR